MGIDECEWCNLTAKDKQWLLYETVFWDIYLADKQDYVGRCILVLKRHCDSFMHLEDDEWQDLKFVIDITEKIMREVLGAELCNWSCLMNDFYKKSNPNPHLHIHMRPRYRKPVQLGQKLFYDSEFGHHYDNQKQVQISAEEMEIVFGKLRAAFDKL